MTTKLGLVRPRWIVYMLIQEQLRNECHRLLPRVGRKEIMTWIKKFSLLQFNRRLSLDHRLTIKHPLIRRSFLRCSLSIKVFNAWYQEKRPLPYLLLMQPITSAPNLDIKASNNPLSSKKVQKEIRSQNDNLLQLKLKRNHHEMQQWRKMKSNY